VTLAGRGALVTGVSREAGIGYAIANRLEELGASVFRHGWSSHDEAQPWGAEPRVEHFEADLADPDGPAEVMAAARAALGHVDILVANHARTGLGRLEELTAEELDGFLAVNVRATLLLVKELALQHDGRPGGRVVLLTSGQHLAAMPREVAYAVSKRNGRTLRACGASSWPLRPRRLWYSRRRPRPASASSASRRNPPIVGIR
jgi:3-oxoacyl-[acyl-carrier protein] reductase